MEDEPTLLDRFMTREARGGQVFHVGIMFGVVGTVMLAFALARVVQLPWQLDANAPVVHSIDNQCGPFSGGLYEIEIAGQHHLCTGADNKCGISAGVDVAYDPDDPAQCRVAARVDRLSDYERFGLSLPLTFMLIGLASASYARARHLARLDLADLDPSEPSHAVARVWLRRICVASLAGAGVFVVLSFLALVSGR